MILKIIRAIFSGKPAAPSAAPMPEKTAYDLAREKSDAEYWQSRKNRARAPQRCGNWR